MNLDALLTAAEAAKVAGVSKQLVNYWRISGKLARTACGRYRLGDVLTVEAQTRRTPQSHRV